MDLRPLTDGELLAALSALAAQEREKVSDIVEHLAELDRRANVAKTGHATLFEYCRRKLGYSEAAAFLRIRAARAVRNQPRLLEELRGGRIHLDALARLGPYITDDNAQEVLARAAGASKDQILRLAVDLGAPATAPDRDVIRPMPRRETTEPASPHPNGEAFVIAPPERMRIAFSASPRLVEALERLKTLRRHKFPSARLEDIIEEAACEWISRLEPKESRKKGAASVAPRRRSRRIPASVKAAVWARDAGRCVFVAPDGTRCGSSEFIQYDHILPWSEGGASSEENVRLLCRSHNLWRARERFGPRRRKRGQVCPDTPAHGLETDPAGGG